MSEFNADINSAGDGWIQVTISGDNAHLLTEEQIASSLSTLPIAGEGKELDGWQLVPVEPTVAMRMPWKTMRGDAWYDKYKAMLDAAPEAGKVHGEHLKALQSLKVLPFSGNALIQIVEGLKGSMEHGTWRDDKGMRLKDTNEWVLFYTTFKNAGSKKDAIEPHPDDLAVDRFAAEMKAKLAKKRAEGLGGWENKDECTAEFLSQLLRDHVEKGDPVDVGNIAMMLQQRGERISSPGKDGGQEVEAVGDRGEPCPNCKGEGCQTGDPEGAPLEACDYCNGSGKKISTQPASTALVERLCRSPIIEDLTPSSAYWDACETLQDRYDLMKKLIRKAISSAGMTTTAWQDVLAERDRQKAVEGWTPEHDDGHTDNELSRAAACYAIGNIAYWPWSLDWWKPKDRRRDLVKSAALIIAEIERLDRSALSASQSTSREGER